MRTIRIVALTVGGLFVLYQLLIALIPEDRIVGFHFPRDSAKHKIAFWSAFLAAIAISALMLWYVVNHH
jgi:hypothetical protein